MVLQVVNSVEEFEIVCKKNAGIKVIHFFADWAEQCKQMDEVLTELQKKHTSITFYSVEAEKIPKLSHKYEIVAVPTIIFIKNEGVIDRVNGANVGELTQKVEHLASRTDTAAPEANSESKKEEELKQRLKALINAAPCMLFMKGTPTDPQCGFSKQVIAILTDLNAQYSTFNILADNVIRQGLKEYSEWPTYPQLYINGELIGGLDIIKEMVSSGELEKTIPHRQSLDDRLKLLINKAPVMIFMKGEATAPQCKFSKQLMAMLATSKKVSYKTFNILEDDDVRQGLKTYSNWPTYPQVYVKGELIGGVDIVKELHETGELESTLCVSGQ